VAWRARALAACAFLPPPWRYTCLRRSVVLYPLIRRAGRPVSLHSGVRKVAAGALAAHAEIARFPESGP
jgi:hypothetical protein